MFTDTSKIDDDEFRFRWVIGVAKEYRRGKRTPHLKPIQAVCVREHIKYFLSATAKF